MLPRLEHEEALELGFLPTRLLRFDDESLTSF